MVDPFGPPVEKALVFETGGRQLALPIASVAQVVAPGKKFCSLVAPTAAAGVLIHQQQAWPVFSVPGMLGEPMVYEPMTVLADSGGDGLGFTASRVVGVLEGAALKGVSTLELKAMFS